MHSLKKERLRNRNSQDLSRPQLTSNTDGVADQTSTSASRLTAGARHSTPVGWSATRSISVPRWHCSLVCRATGPTRA